MTRAKVIDYPVVAGVIGRMLVLLAVFLLVPAIVSLCYGESDWMAFAVTSACSAAVGLPLLVRMSCSRPNLRYREAFLLTSVVWVLYSAIGMIPFLFSSHPLSVSEAFFETMSGFTTTGATVIADVESLSKGLLLWRALIQWIGGLGIVLFVLLVLPALDQKGGISLFNAEITGITHDKIHPRIRATARSLWIIYGCLTLMLVTLLWLGPMDLFDAVCQAFSTMSTGGFSTRNASIAAFDSDYVSVVITVFMLIGGVSFILLRTLVAGHWREFLSNDVLRVYIAIVAVCVVAVSLSSVLAGDESLSRPGRLLVDSSFLVASAITSTGFSLADFSLWGPFALLTVFFMMFCGACAGSTTGGMKVDRVAALGRNILAQLRITVYPRHIVNVKVSGKSVDATSMNRICGFVALYFSLFLLGSAVLTLYGLSVTDATFAAASCIGNSGLGYGVTGAAGGFGLLPAPSLWLLSLLMLAGRLELYTVIVLFTRRFWL